VAETRWHRRRDARPAELVEAASLCFGRTGYVATRVEEIAAHAGVTVGTVYRYFPNKEALFGAVLDESRKRLPTGWAVAERDPIRLLRETLDRWWAFLTEPAQAVLLRATILEDPEGPDAARSYAREVRSRLEQQIGGVLRLGMAAGVFRSVEVPHLGRAIGDTLIGGAVTRGTAAVGTPIDDPVAHLSALTNALLHGVVNRAPPPPPPRSQTSAPAGSASPAPRTRTDSW
jgi:AcrR family transcriptional regulator